MYDINTYSSMHLPAYKIAVLSRNFLSKFQTFHSMRNSKSLHISSSGLGHCNPPHMSTTLNSIVNSIWICCQLDRNCSIYTFMFIKTLLHPILPYIYEWWSYLGEFLMLRQVKCVADSLQDFAIIIVSKPRFSSWIADQLMPWSPFWFWQLAMDNLMWIGRDSWSIVLTFDSEIITRPGLVVVVLM